MTEYSMKLVQLTHDMSTGLDSLSATQTSTDAYATLTQQQLSTQYISWLSY